MFIQLNGEKREIVDDTSLAALLVSLDLKLAQVAVELNQKVIRRADWRTTNLRDGDKVEIVHFVGGGNGNIICPCLQ